MAVPKKSRSRCKVIGYNLAGEFVTLREGDNEFIVLADNPKQDGFSVPAIIRFRTIYGERRALRGKKNRNKRSLLSVKRR
jgi:hypothetical protein